MLTLDNFISDYQHFVIQYPDFDRRMNYVSVLIQVNYLHIYKECFEYVEKTK